VTETQKKAKRRKERVRPGGRATVFFLLRNGVSPLGTFRPLLSDNKRQKQRNQSNRRRNNKRKCFNDSVNTKTLLASELFVLLGIFFDSLLLSFFLFLLSLASAHLSFSYPMLLSIWIPNTKFS